METQVIGERIRTIRKSKKMRQSDLADRSEFTQSHISQIEKGDKVPTIEGIQRIAEALGVSSTLLQDESLPTENLEEISEILSKISSWPPDKLRSLNEILIRLMH